MGQGPSTPDTIKTTPNIFNTTKCPLDNDIKKKKCNEYSTVNDTKLLKYIKCNYYTAKEYQDIDKNLLPKYMSKIRKTVNVGNTKIIDNETRNELFENLKYDKEKHKDDMDIYQFSMNKEQLKKLEETIDNILDNLSKNVIGGKIPGPIYVAYSKILDYNGSYLTRYVDTKKNDGNEIKRRFFTDLSKELKNNRTVVDNTIFARYVWKGNIDLIILIPNMNNLNKIHTNMFDYYINNQIVDYIVNNNFMNNIIPNDMSIYPKYLHKKIKKEFNFERDNNNICTFHGCNTQEHTENLDVILPIFSKDDSTMRNNVKSTKIYLPNKCLRTVDYVKNGYNPKGNEIRDKKLFNINVDYNDIVFEMIFCMAIDCMFENADKDFGVAKRWNNYIDKYNKNPNSLREDEICDDNIVKHMNTYIYECIKGTPPPKQEGEETPGLAIEPITIEKDHYTKWNDDIMKELARRKSIFPGIQQYTYPFFQFIPNESKINDKIFYLPWGNRLLTNNEYLIENEFKTEIKSHNNVYSLFTNEYGQLGIKQNGRIKKWYSTFKFPRDNYGIKLTIGCKITVVNDKDSTILTLKITNQTDFKVPLSLIVDNNGSIIVYENGFKPINMTRPFTISSNSSANDIDTINKQGLWYYMTGKKSAYDNNIERTTEIERTTDIEKTTGTKVNIGIEEDIGIPIISKRIITYLK